MKPLDLADALEQIAKLEKRVAKLEAAAKKGSGTPGVVKPS